MCFLGVMEARKEAAPRRLFRWGGRGPHQEFPRGNEDHFQGFRPRGKIKGQDKDFRSGYKKER